MAEEGILRRRDGGCGILGRIHSGPLVVELSSPRRQAGLCENPSNSIDVPAQSLARRGRSRMSALLSLKRNEPMACSSPLADFSTSGYRVSHWQIYDHAPRINVALGSCRRADLASSEIRTKLSLFDHREIDSANSWQISRNDVKGTLLLSSKKFTAELTIACDKVPNESGRSFALHIQWVGSGSIK